MSEESSEKTEVQKLCDFINTEENEGRLHKSQELIHLIGNACLEMLTNAIAERYGSIEYKKNHESRNA